MIEKKNAGEFGDAKIVGIIKEVAPTSGAKTDEELGVHEFQTKYFGGNPIYLDEDRKFYDILGNRSLLNQRLHTWNPFQLFRDFRELNKRTSSKKITGNLLGEGFIQGGLFVISKSHNKVFTYFELTGTPFPYDEIKQAIESCQA